VNESRGPEGWNAVVRRTDERDGICGALDT
jgi:hypothetical protein